VTTATGNATTKGMRWVPGGEFAMGSEDFYPEERPIRSVPVDGLWIDEHPVTNLQFGRFVKATGYVTVAELPPDPADFPDAEPEQLVPGSLVFQPSQGPVDLRDFRNWWAYVPGAFWRRPEGPGSNLGGRDRHPVVHVAHADAAAYAAWAGKALPTEAEWEHAARGGLDGAVFAWGDEFAPGGRMLANTWQGEFPWQNLLADGYAGTSPVGSFRPNGYGLVDMTGNVWEWTCDDFTPDHSAPAARPCCVPAAAGESAPRKVIKGGSHLCAPSYCLRYRPAARQSETVDTGTSHIGFRCVLRGR
jgi:formylglycine-generating enzyme